MPPAPPSPEQANAEAVSVWRLLRKGAVLVIGGTVLLVGLAMVVLPGPAVVVIPAGLGILATEFLWARRLLEKARAKVQETAARVRHPGH